MMINDLHTEVSQAQLLVPATRTAGENGTGVDVQGYIGKLKAVLHSAAGTGTSPTLDVKVQDSADNSTFADVSGLTFSQVTTAISLQSLGIDTRLVKRYIRLVTTLTGTSPSFVCAAVMLGQKKIQ